ncbi:MAG: hypothetical protein L6422_11840, partial [Candidatus Marinimicrobia bacterium]|nr:hypothetical protein [Candidatus Neomarinimicrobiota bacterium]
SLPNVSVVQVKDTSYGNMTITDKGFIMVLPVPGHGEMKGISIPSPEQAQNIYNSYMMIVFSRAVRFNTLEEIKSLRVVGQHEKAQQNNGADA